LLYAAGKDGADGFNDGDGEEEEMHMLEGGALPIIDLLKKKQLRLHGGPDGLAKYQARKKKNKQNVDAYVDYRQVIPQSLLRLKEAALRAQANPEELDEYIDLERQFEECIPDILLFGCNLPSDTVEVRALWIAYGDGSRVMALSPPERPTKEWEVVNYCTVPVKPRDDRSSLPGVNKQVSDIVLLVLRVLSIDCALPPQDPKLVSAAAAAAISVASESVRISDQSGPGAAGGGNGTGHMNLSGILAATADETTSGGGGSGLVAGDSMLSMGSSAFDSKDQRGSSPPPGARKSNSIPSKSLLDVTFAPTAPWVGVVDMTSFIDDLRRVELKYFDKVENAEGRKIWVAKTVAARIHAPNMSVSDQVFRQLFKVCFHSTFIHP
jgi:hypothetical protein